MKIAAYVVQKHAKQTYKKECLDVRQFAGFKMIIDSIERKGYVVDYAGIDTIYKYDVVLVSITAQCDWWTFVRERHYWKKKDVKVIVGGAGVLNVRHLLPFADYFVLGAGQNLIIEILEALRKGDDFEHKNVINSKTFNSKKNYFIKQEPAYPYEIDLSHNNVYKQNNIGCNHKCFFCGYTWHRKHNKAGNAFEWDSVAIDLSTTEAAMLDFVEGKKDINFKTFRTTAIDGFSERLRFMVNKKIKKEHIDLFLEKMITDEEAKAHQIKLFNIVGYPTETKEDWFELLEHFKNTEKHKKVSEAEWCIILHSTPFRSMPATPMANAPVSYINYRKKISKVLGGHLAGNRIYAGKNMWAVESMGTESLPTVFEDMIMNRGTEEEAEKVLKLAISKKYWASKTSIKLKTLESYFDAYKFFSGYPKGGAPNNYIKTYAEVERLQKDWV